MIASKNDNLDLGDDIDIVCKPLNGYSASPGIEAQSLFEVSFKIFVILIAMIIIIIIVVIIVVIIITIMVLIIILILKSNSNSNLKNNRLKYVLLLEYCIHIYSSCQIQFF